MPTGRAATRRRRTFVVLVGALVVGLAMGATLANRAGNGQDGLTDAGPSDSGRPAPASWESQTAEAQARIDGLRIAMTVEELRERYGPPTGRYPAPEKPFSIKEEWVYKDDLAAVQLLINAVGAVEYFAVTARDADFKIKAPFDACGEPNQPFVLNSTTLDQLADCSTYVFGSLGASYANFGLSWGGSHADSWRQRSVGVNVYGQAFFHGKPIDETNSAQAENHFGDLFQLMGTVKGYTPESSVDQGQRVVQCRRELGNAYDPSGIRLQSKWIQLACDNLKMITMDEQVNKLKSSPAWRDYTRVGKVNTFAVTAPSLFSASPLLFYAIWDIGLEETSIPLP